MNADFRYWQAIERRYCLFGLLGRRPCLLVDALVATHWLDEHPEHRLVIHDWSEHSNDYAHARLARRGLRLADGSVPRLLKLSKYERERAQEVFGLTSQPKQQQPLTKAAPSSAVQRRPAPYSAVQPVPIPIPIPIPTPTPRSKPAQIHARAREDSQVADDGTQDQPQSGRINIEPQGWAEAGKQWLDEHPELTQGLEVAQVVEIDPGLDRLNRNLATLAATVADPQSRTRTRATSPSPISAVVAPLAAEADHEAANTQRYIAEVADQAIKLWPADQDLWRPWLTKTLSLLYSKDLLSDFLTKLTYCRESCDPAVRATKDLGDMSPYADKYLVKAAIDICKAHNLRWPDFPACVNGAKNAKA